MRNARGAPVGTRVLFDHESTFVAAWPRLPASLGNVTHAAGPGGQARARACERASRSCRPCPASG